MTPHDEAFARYFELLMLWNKRINLTAVSDAKTFRLKHIDDAMALLPHLAETKRLLDLGTGAGIPGIILKITRPELELVLVDATRKKIAFCDEAIRKLGLAGIRAVWGRSEDPDLILKLGTFDTVLSRATWNLAGFIPMAKPYTELHGRILAMKGPKWEEELAEAASELSDSGIAFEGAHPFTLENGDERCILTFRRNG